MAVHFFNDTWFYRLFFKLQLSECDHVGNPVENNPDVDSEWTRLGVELSSWVRRNVDYLYPETTKDVSECSQITSYQGNVEINRGIIFLWVCIIFVTVVVPLLVAKFLDFCEGKQLQSAPDESSTNDESEDPRENQNTITAVGKPAPKETIPLYSISFYAGRTFNPSCDVPSFLKRTIDCLFQELDKHLIDKTPPPHDGPLHSTVTSSVRLPRRPILRATGRRSSSPSLPSQDPRGDDPTETIAFREFQKDIVYNNTYTHLINVPDSVQQSLNGKNKRLMDFFINSCLVNFEELCVSNFIVKYALHLLEKVLRTMSPYHGLRFVQCSPTGSMLKGIKVSAANQFDFSFVFQCTEFELSSAIDHGINPEIPPGKLVLNVVENEDHEVPSRLLKQFQEKKCISPQEFLNSVCELTDIALQKLYKEGRPVIDRLPFRIQRATSPGLQLSLDTRNVVGFHNPDIRIQLIPSLLLSCNKWIDPNHLYAVPSWSNVDIKRKMAPRNRYTTQPIQATPHDLFWNMSFGELEHFFFNKMDQKCHYRGMFGCHKIVIQILKFLFASQSRKTLLSRGEVTSYMIETVVSYMMVESRTNQWGMDQLSDRVSDAILFLKRALHNGRLPNFYVNNPHLADESEFFKQIKLLSPGRQENLLGDISPDTVSKMLNFIDSRLAEYNLKDCVTSEYSEDMWEYEYFVYL